MIESPTTQARRHNYQMKPWGSCQMSTTEFVVGGDFLLFSLISLGTCALRTRIARGGRWPAHCQHVPSTLIAGRGPHRKNWLCSLPGQLVDGKRLPARCQHFWFGNTMHRKDLLCSQQADWSTHCLPSGSHCLTQTHSQSQHVYDGSMLVCKQCVGTTFQICKVSSSVYSVSFVRSTFGFGTCTFTVSIFASSSSPSTSSTVLIVVPIEERLSHCRTHCAPHCRQL